MKNYALKFMSILLIAAFSSASMAREETSGNTRYTSGIAENEIENVISRYSEEFELPGDSSAFSESDIAEVVRKARDIHTSAPIKRGDTSEAYDVIIQIGHYKRTSGKTGGQGKYVNEQQIASMIGHGLAQQLSKRKVNGNSIKALLIGADDYNKNLKTKIFLSLHTDSANPPGCKLGPSMGYESNDDAKGMHMVGLALALSLDINAEKFMKDNYTRNLSGYYAYRSINASIFKGLLEMSELSCPAQELNLLANNGVLVDNLATGIEFALR